MARGGKREGAGRKPGATSRLANAAREAASATGELPHEFLLRVVRGEDVFLDAPKDGQQAVHRKPTFAERLDAAKAAAPYFAPKLAATNVNHHGVVGWMDLAESVTQEQQLAVAKEMMRSAGFEIDE